MPKEKDTGSDKPAADVILYCTPWCPACRSARQFLKEHRIEYVEIDISRDREAAARVRDWTHGNETTPTFSIRGQIVVDWDKERVVELLGRQ
jgi:glutaredoxin